MHRILTYLDPRCRPGVRWIHLHIAVGLAFLGGVMVALSGVWAVHHYAAGGFRWSRPAPQIRLSGVPTPPTWSLVTYVVRVHNQGATNSCVGQTLSTITEIEARERGYSVAESAGFLWNQLNGGVDQGISYQAGFGLLQREGDAPLSVVPWDGANYSGVYAPDGAALRAAYPYRANPGYHSIAVTDQQTIKAEIAAGHPLAYATNWSQNWVNHWTDPAALGSQDGTVVFAHSTTLVGYTPGGVILLNSWGTAWGSGGYAFLPWGVLAASGGQIAVSDIALPPRVRHHAPPFPARLWNEYRRAHHESVIPYRDRRHRLTWPASVWVHHQWLKGITARGTWRAGHPGHTTYSFRHGTIWCWPATHRCKTGKPRAVKLGGTPAELVCSAQHRECRRALLTLVNTDRAARGLPPYALDWTQSRGTPSCAGSAGHSHAMAQSGSIWHVNAAYPAQSFPMNLCVTASAAGENAGVAMSGDRWADLVRIDNQMMAEPWTPGCSGNHACNLMSATFTRIGIGISSRDGATYLTEDFLQ